jgi:hypothetical protein
VAEESRLASPVRPHAPLASSTYDGDRSPERRGLSLRVLHDVDAPSGLWVLAEHAVPQEDLESFCASEDLRLCQDVCNALKHSSLSDPKQGREFSLAREYGGAGRGRFAGDSTLVLLSLGKQARCVRSCGSMRHALDRLSGKAWSCCLISAAA